jgi:hypothetical protein
MWQASHLCHVGHGSWNRHKVNASALRCVRAAGTEDRLIENEDND